MKGLRLPSRLLLADVGGPDDTLSSSSSSSSLRSDDALLSSSIFSSKSILATPAVASSISNDKAPEREAVELCGDLLLALDRDDDDLDRDDLLEVAADRVEADLLEATDTD